MTGTCNAQSMHTWLKGMCVSVIAIRTSGITAAKTNLRATQQRSCACWTRHCLWFVRTRHIPLASDEGLRLISREYRIVLQVSGRVSSKHGHNEVALKSRLLLCPSLRPQKPCSRMAVNTLSVVLHAKFLSWDVISSVRPSDRLMSRNRAAPPVSRPRAGLCPTDNRLYQKADPRPMWIRAI
ncbi:hypothetical protein DAEQUDRAFT_117382 [Daedalea quercina L-15889]|uniref:Uncharacterized protein n=1 Tax=Daedalea quercina L-15889 TaxID=1314783 RepID=A0A165KSL1_9APHY|nr:hypothetical protein DAEQUDRAFT_117382 [Daedalea quercina L-15889]